MRRALPNCGTLSSMSVSSPGELRHGWLFSKGADLSLVGAPVLLALTCYLIERVHGGGRTLERDYALYLSQFLLGNTTHVVLTFLALGTRPELLTPVPGQRGILVFGSLFAFIASFALFWVTSVTFPTFAELGITIGFVFAQHHRLAQIKGLWALYSLRAGQRPAPDERVVQNHFVAVLLLCLVARLLLFPKSSDRMTAQLAPIPGVFPPLPFEGVYVLCAVVALGGAYTLYTVWKAGAPLAKRIYLSAHVFAIVLAMYTPLWGLVVTSGIHGMEYYFLTEKMLMTKDGDARKISRLGAWILMALAMVPLLVVGSMQAPFARGFVTATPAIHTALIALNALVMAHYFADAFVYRLRLPGVRRVVLRRLGFAH